MVNATEEGRDTGIRICDAGGKGQWLPLGGAAEADWDNRLRVFLYGIGLLYCFVGVSIIADVFMAAIERVTSRKKRVPLPDHPGRSVTRNVWNETVANLTLMALGSSAPEILLALNDVVKREFFAGQMGPSTIVGSAAFNLFVIIAVCINAIPNGETRMVKETQVFFITAVWSIFAYLWLLVIVQVWTPGIISIEEGALTVIFFPMLVWMSYQSDLGRFTKENFYAMLSSLCTRSSSGDENYSEGSGDGSNNICIVLCGCCLGIWASICRAICSPILRCLCCCFRRRRKDNQQLELDGEDEAIEAGVIDESVDVRDDDQPILDENAEPIDCEEGVLTFTKEVMEIEVGYEEITVPISVLRKNGSEGRVSVQFRVEGITATPGYDFEELEGQLDFKSGITHAEIELIILPKTKGERDDVLQVYLEDPDGDCILNPNTDGGEDACLLTILLRNENGVDNRLGGRIYYLLDYLFNMDEIWLGHTSWKEQVLEAIYVGGSSEEQSQAKWTDWTMHLLCVPWKFFYAAACPPPTYMGGWVCFTLALAHIGLLTSVISDFAELFGCVAGVSDNITAITIVALGTSLPDTFASKAAATQDEWADASIVNVTGSNSVNVFLGIGMPWLMGAIKWKMTGPNQKWLKWYGEDHLDKYPGGAFVVEGAGDLGFSVIVFTLFALVCLTVVQIRRKVYGGELGGPPDMKATSSFLLVMLWLAYVGLQVWKSGQPDATVVAQVVAVLFTIPILIVLMVIFLILLQVLKVSKRYIGEEGFWGIFIAVCLIGLRMLVFLMFQNA